jgi:hypothetical protein
MITFQLTFAPRVPRVYTLRWEKGSLGMIISMNNEYFTQENGMVRRQGLLLRIAERRKRSQLTGHIRRLSDRP